MNIQRAVELMAKLHVKDRDSGRSTYFKLNPCQRIFTDKISEQHERVGMIRAIVLKSRRVGISSETDSLLFLHACSREQAHAKIVAHVSDTAEGLFRVPRDMARELSGKTPIGEIRVRDIHVHHAGGNSILDIATAGSVASGRGLTLSAVHLSEAAQFPGDESFLSLLPAVSEGPDTMVVIESTALGRVGIGKAFYEFWKSAATGKNGYVPIFIGWLDDPTCIANPADADDAPATDMEKELMARPFKATRKQIAWMRMTIENKCRGLEPLFCQEFPWTPDVAFVSTGDPAFTTQEKAHVRKTVGKPAARGHLEWSGEAQTFVETRMGALHLWERPVPGHHYFVGADAAVGIEEGDFAAYVVMDGDTGHQVARYADRVTPEVFAEFLNLVGRWYGKAMLNVELTGNSGREVIRCLRDQLRYSNFYMWRGKDDKLITKKGSPLIGWEMTQYSRRKLYDAFRVAVRGSMKGESFPSYTVRDEACLEQMDIATLGESGRWEISQGHDDILVATMLSNIAYMQNQPPTVARRMYADEAVAGAESDRMIVPYTAAQPKYQDDVALSLQRHYRKVMTMSRRPRVQIDRLAGV